MRIQILILGFKGLIGKAKIQNANVWKNKNTEFLCLKKKLPEFHPAINIRKTLRYPLDRNFFSGQRFPPFQHLGVNVK